MFKQKSGAEQGRVRHCKAGHGKAVPGKTKQGKARRGSAGQGGAVTSRNIFSSASWRADATAAASRLNAATSSLWVFMWCCRSVHDARAALKSACVVGGGGGDGGGVGRGLCVDGVMVGWW